MQITEVRETAQFIQAAWDATVVVVTITPQQWIEVRNNPARQIDPSAQLDFLRLEYIDDNCWTIHHLTHNGIAKGHATFSNSMVGFMYATITNFIEGL